MVYSHLISTLFRDTSDSIYWYPARTG